MMLPSELSVELASERPPTLMDVRLADDFAACHLPGAINNAVFEVAFAERFPSQIPERSTPVRAYGAASGSIEACMAVEKLQRAGYTDVAELEGGLEAWIKSGQPVVTGNPLPASLPPPDGRLAVDLDASSIEWTGRNLLNKHHGSVGLKSGHLDFQNGQLISGEIVIDLLRLDCSDLSGTPYHDVLIRHLHDHDFFDVVRFPEVVLTITSATAIPESGPGAANLGLTADLTIKGITLPINFDAATGLTPDGHAAAQAVFSIDRTRWGVLYGSGKFFRRLAGHLVNDTFWFEVKIVTK